VAVSRLSRQQDRPAEPGLRLLAPEIIPLDPSEEERLLDDLARLLLEARSGSLPQDELAVSGVAPRLSED
jgi:hypothetical protein